MRTTKHHLQPPVDASPDDRFTFLIVLVSWISICSRFLLSRVEVQHDWIRSRSSTPHRRLSTNETKGQMRDERKEHDIFATKPTSLPSLFRNEPFHYYHHHHGLVATKRTTKHRGARLTEQTRGRQGKSTDVLRSSHRYSYARRPASGQLSE